MLKLLYATAIKRKPMYKAYSHLSLNMVIYPQALLFSSYSSSYSHCYIVDGVAAVASGASLGAVVAGVV